MLHTICRSPMNAVVWTPSERSGFQVKRSRQPVPFRRHISSLLDRVVEYGTLAEDAMYSSTLMPNAMQSPVVQCRKPFLLLSQSHADCHHCTAKPCIYPLAMWHFLCARHG